MQHGVIVLREVHRQAVSGRAEGEARGAKRWTISKLQGLPVRARQRLVCHTALSSLWSSAPVRHARRSCPDGRPTHRLCRSSGPLSIPLPALPCPGRYKDGELSVGENSCIDRCSSKYWQVGWAAQEGLEMSEMSAALQGACGGRVGLLVSAVVQHTYRCCCPRALAGTAVSGSSCGKHKAALTFT